MMNTLINQFYDNIQDLYGDYRMMYQIKAKTDRALNMLKKTGHIFHIEKTDTFIRGVVESQRTKNLLYSPRIMLDGNYMCGTENLTKCMGITTSPPSICKHAILLLMAAVKDSMLTPNDACEIIEQSLSKRSHYIIEEAKMIFDNYNNLTSSLEFRVIHIMPEDIVAF